MHTSSGKSKNRICTTPFKQKHWWMVYVDADVASDGVLRIGSSFSVISSEPLTTRLKALPKSLVVLPNEIRILLVFSFALRTEVWTGWWIVWLFETCIESVSIASVERSMIETVAVWIRQDWEQYGVAELRSWTRVLCVGVNNFGATIPTP